MTEKTTSKRVKFKIKIDQEKCIGCGSCVAVCPEIFKINDEGKVEAIVEEIEKLGCSKTAEENCPVKAIEVYPVK